MGKNCQEHKILMQKAIQNEIHSVRGNGRDNEDQPVTGNGRENEDHPVRGNRRENEDHPVSGSSNRDKIPLVSENSHGAVQRNYGEQGNQYKCLRIQHWEKTMENKDKRNGKQQNNQASDREKRVFLDEQYVKTAAQMERELFADKDFEDYEPEDSEAEARSYEKLVNRLRKEGVYREEFADMAEFPGIEKADAEEASGTKEAMDEEDIKAPQFPFSGRKKYARVHVGKVAGVALLCCACIFAASMTSQANRNYLVNNIRVWSGNDTKTVVDNSEQNEKVDTAEYEAVEEIEKQLGVEMPEFYYRPNGFEFVNYEVDMAVDIAKIEYQYQDNIIFLVVDKQNTDAASGIVSADKIKKTMLVNGSEGLEIEIQEIQGKQDKISTYSAQWKMNDTMYYMSGKLAEQELEKILEQMKF
jgi:hypothetical protein